MRKLLLIGSGLFAALNSGDRSPRESSFSKRISAGGSAQAASSSSAVAANYGGYCEDVDWRALARLQIRSLKDIFNELKEVLLRGDIERAKWLFEMMKLRHRSKDELDQFIKDVQPVNLSPISEQRVDNYARKDLTRLIVGAQDFARAAEVLVNGPEIGAIADLLALDLYNLGDDYYNLGSIGSLGSPLNSRVAMIILKAEKALLEGCTDMAFLENIHRIINTSKNNIFNKFLRERAENVLAQIEQVLRKK